MSPAGGQLLWKRSAVEHYIFQIDQFLEQLLVVCHLTCGHPARGTEILSLRYVNTMHGQQRGIARARVRVLIAHPNSPFYPFSSPHESTSGPVTGGRIRQNRAYNKKGYHC
jgi:hypothetical protein